MRCLPAICKEEPLLPRSLLQCLVLHRDLLKFYLCLAASLMDIASFFLDHRRCPKLLGGVPLLSDRLSVIRAPRMVLIAAIASPISIVDGVPLQCNILTIPPGTNVRDSILILQRRIPSLAPVPTVLKCACQVGFVSQQMKLVSLRFQAQGCHNRTV